MSFTVKVIKGREKWDIPCDETTTFGALRKEVETKAGCVEGGIRLVHKGKSFPDNKTLSSEKVNAGTKMMALITPKQREVEEKAKKAENMARESAALDKMRERAGEKAQSVVASPAVNKNVIRGDDAVEGQTSVLLVKGREKFRVNVALSATVGELKSLASALEGVQAAARDMKLLFKGKFLVDSSIISDCGVFDGASLMLMFSARHHDAQDAKVELNEIEQSCIKFEQKVRTVTSKARSRLLQGADLIVAKNEVFDIFARLEDNLRSVRGEEERCKALMEKLKALESTLEELRLYS